ncbi:MAG: restriction endonuclease subunit S [Proteobacteria bacterium]|nr:restriction endonuclease subunit S [Pseudomonadota bacterium]
MVGKYQTYLKYKESSVDWLGDIPSHWEEKRLKYLAMAYPSNVDKRNNSGEQSVELCNYTDVYRNEIITSEISFMKATATEDQIEKFTLQKGDTIITKDSEDPSDIAVPAYVPKDLDGVVCGYHLAVIRPKKNTNGEFLKRVFESNYAKSIFTTRANGLTRYGLGTYAIDNIVYPEPSFSEQEKIVAFLNHEISKIDWLIEKQQQLIELLNEKRLAVISHAVTKGINPNVKMKDSCVKWLGEVPDHWGLRALRFVGTCQNGINIGAEYFGSGYPFVSYGDVYRNGILQKEITGLVQSNELDRKAYSVSEGDVLFTRTSETIDEIGFASTCLETIEEATFAGFLIRFRPRKNFLDAGFSKYYFRNILLRAFFIREMNLVTRASLSQNLLKKLPVVLPALEEQKKISEFLDKKVSVFSKLINKADFAINSMKERRTALISSAITGKIDVRNWQPDKQTAA